MELRYLAVVSRRSAACKLFSSLQLKNGTQINVSVLLTCRKYVNAYLEEKGLQLLESEADEREQRSAEKVFDCL